MTSSCKSPNHFERRDIVYCQVSRFFCLVCTHQTASPLTPPTNPSQQRVKSPQQQQKGPPCDPPARAAAPGAPAEPRGAATRSPPIAIAAPLSCCPARSRRRPRAAPHPTRLRRCRGAALCLLRQLHSCHGVQGLRQPAAEGVQGDSEGPNCGRERAATHLVGDSGHRRGLLAGFLGGRPALDTQGGCSAHPLSRQEHSTGGDLLTCSAAVAMLSLPSTPPCRSRRRRSPRTQHLTTCWSGTTAWRGLLAQTLKEASTTARACCQTRLPACLSCRSCSAALHKAALAWLASSIRPPRHHCLKAPQCLPACPNVCPQAR